MCLGSLAPPSCRLPSAAGKYNTNGELKAGQVDLCVGEVGFLCLEGVAAAGVAAGEREFRMANELVAFEGDAELAGDVHCEFHTCMVAESRLIVERKT